MATGRPAILIPLPQSYQDEQRKNADYFSSLGLGEVIEQEQATPELLWETIGKMSRRIDRYRERFSRIKVADGKEKLLSLISEIVFQRQ
jgi:UDP-N-acetylglucosamine:LPS N-acetylglucosamine transferase